MWKYEAEMSFLLPFLVERKSTSSRPISSDEFSDDDDSTQNNAPQMNTELENVYIKRESSPMSTEMTENVPQIYADAPKVFPLNVEISTENDVNTNSLPTVTQEAPVTRKRNIRLRKTLVRAETSSSVLMRYLLEKNDSRQKLDETDNFFLNMASMVKKLTPYKQAVARAKVFAIISEMELDSFSTSSSECPSELPTAASSFSKCNDN